MSRIRKVIMFEKDRIDIEFEEEMLRFKVYDCEVRKPTRYVSTLESLDQPRFVSFLCLMSCLVTRLIQLKLILFLKACRGVRFEASKSIFGCSLRTFAV